MFSYEIVNSENISDFVKCQYNVYIGDPLAFDRRVVGDGLLDNPFVYVQVETRYKHAPTYFNNDYVNIPPIEAFILYILRNEKRLHMLMNHMEAVYNRGVRVLGCTCSSLSSCHFEVLNYIATYTHWLKQEARKRMCDFPPVDLKFLDDDDSSLWDFKDGFAQQAQLQELIRGEVHRQLHVILAKPDSGYSNFPNQGQSIENQAIQLLRQETFDQWDAYDILKRFAQKHKLDDCACERLFSSQPDRALQAISHPAKDKNGKPISENVEFNYSALVMRRLRIE